MLVNNQFNFNPLYTGNLYTDTVANSDDSDEIHDLHCLLRLKQPYGTYIHQKLGHFTSGPLKYTIGSPELFYQYVGENT